MYKNLYNALQEKGINKTKLSKDLGMYRSTLYDKLNGLTDFNKKEFDYIYKNYLEEYDYWYLSETTKKLDSHSQK